MAIGCTIIAMRESVARLCATIYISTVGEMYVLYAADNAGLSEQSTTT